MSIKCSAYCSDVLFAGLPHLGAILVADAELQLCVEHQAQP